MWSAIFIVVVLFSTSLVVFGQSKFGKRPSGKRLERIQQSPNYKDGKFINQSNSPVFSPNTGKFAAMMEFFTETNEYLSPEDSIPCIKTDLKTLDIHNNVLVWLGHSSYFMQIEGKRILVDPVLNGHASPFSWMIKAFKGTGCYKPEDIPDIDYLIITHDHWDHLDYETVTKLRPRVLKVICALGVGSHLQYWGFDANSIIELDWYEQSVLDSGWVIHATPARHFSGRSLKRNRTLWASFVLKTPERNIFIGGDGGYDKHFAQIGNEFGPFDLAILEMGQYNQKWKYIHLLPEQFFQAAADLKAKRVLPVHNSKFALSRHAWNEPLEKLSGYSRSYSIPLLTPMIGEQLNLNDTTRLFTAWWREVR